MTAAGYEEALRARQEVTTVSTLCAGRYCLQRSLATALLCRMRGHVPTWCSGVRTTPFGAHAWVGGGRGQTHGRARRHRHLPGDDRGVGAGADLT
ncbi:hypothetical protein GCM10010252_62030 [Streptomyces aureoverticillatus]|nr:hypothetical protein GCM10010252_62030 [Streptomyces aureoverticillatus]